MSHLQLPSKVHSAPICTYSVATSCVEWILSAYEFTVSVFDVV